MRAVQLDEAFEANFCAAVLRALDPVIFCSLKGTPRMHAPSCCASPLTCQIILPQHCSASPTDLCSTSFFDLACSSSEPVEQHH